MSIFEDLIDELKEENLLEETVIEVHNEKNQTTALQAGRIVTENIQPTITADFADVSPFSQPLEDTEYAEEVYIAEEVELTDAPIVLENTDLFTSETKTEIVTEEAKNYPEVEKTKMVVSEKEYFRKRAVEEVAGLQMVDHVLAGVEREQMKSMPQPYDDLPVKLALHDFVQIAHDTNTTEHAQAEFRLMQETEDWYSALSHRDKHITVAHLRRYCETSKPPLSPQAMISLARFYRNSPFSESIRSKFDLIVTRLFSHEIEEDQREMLFDRNDLVQQIKELYADWSSIQLYSADEDNSEILISTLKFEDFISEVDRAKNFDELIASDFFNRVRMFKEECSENFFAPIVTAIAVESNVRIGNRYVELLQKERENTNISKIEEKYGFLHDQAISDATGKTLQLVELLKEKTERRAAAEIVEVSVKEHERTQIYIEKKPRNKLFGVNKWLLAATILTIFVCVGLYFWAEVEVRETTKVSPGVVKVSLENSAMGDYIKTARITDEIFFGITMDTWENLDSEKKEEFLKKILEIGPEKGFKKVQLINENGRSVGFASVEKVEVYHQ
jgi:hypothetical protein